MNHPVHKLSCGKLSCRPILKVQFLQLGSDTICSVPRVPLRHYGEKGGEDLFSCYHKILSIMLETEFKRQFSGFMHG